MIPRQPHQFVARAISNMPMAMVYRGAPPFVGISFATLLIITYVPATSMFLLGLSHYDFV